MENPNFKSQKKRGRKSISDGAISHARKQHKIYLSDEEWSTIGDHSRALEMRRADYIRNVALGYKPLPPDREFREELMKVRMDLKNLFIFINSRHWSESERQQRLAEVGVFKKIYGMIAVARNISYGAAYTEYAAKKDRAVFVGSQNMVGDFGLVFDNRQLDDVWLEFKEAGADYVRKGKEVTRDLFVIESSPSAQESANWSKQDWLDHAKELLEEIDKVSLKVPRKDKKTNKWILDENGKKKLFPVPKTKLCNSKWMAMLHKDSQSGILHLHIMASRFTTDGRLNNNFDIAKRAAQAAEVINQRHGWEQAMSIRQQHIDEINNVINGILADMNGDEISWKDFEARVNAATYTDYKGKDQHYKIRLHPDDEGNVGYSIYRGKSKFTASELGQRMTHISLDDKKILKDVAYSVLRNMDGQSFNWNEYISLMAKKGGLISLKHDSKGNVVNYSVTYNGKQYNASQIGPKLTAKKIIMEWERIARTAETSQGLGK